MARAIFVVPFSSGAPQFPTVPPEQITGYWTLSYSPPPPGTAPYVLVEVDTTAANITTLTNRADCLFICNVNEDGTYTKTALTPAQRNTIRTKINNMGFTGSQYGLLNAAIQSSANQDELAVALATKAFFRHVNKTAMTENDLRQSGFGNQVKTTQAQVIPEAEGKQGRLEKQ